MDGMYFSRVVRAHSGIWGAASETVLNKVQYIICQAKNGCKEMLRYAKCKLSFKTIVL
jgi:hypothetical protein